MRSIMWEYINEEISVLTKLMASHEVEKIVSLIPLEKTKNLIFVASGSSNNVVNASQRFIEQNANANIQLFFPYEFQKETRLLDQYPVAESLIIGISQTGTSMGTYGCLKKAKTMGYSILTLTERPDTPVELIGDWTLNFQCGLEDCNAKTKGYSASLLLLHLIAIELGKRKNIISENMVKALHQELHESIREIPAIIDRTVAWVKHHRKWAKAPFYTVLGHDDNTATAIEGALKLSETVLVPAVTTDVDEYAHGYHRLLEDKSFIILIHSQGNESEKMRKTIEYMRLKTPNRLIIRSTQEPDKSKDEIRLKSKKLTNATLTSVVVFQVLAVLLPELLDQDPNVEKNEDYLTKIKSRSMSSNSESF